MTSVTQPHSLRGDYAGLASRGAAMFIDLGIIALIWAATDFLIDAGFELISVETAEAVQSGPAWVVFWSVATVATAVSYYAFFWSALGQTPGKLVMGIKVIRLDGRLPTPRQSVVRYFGYWASTLLMIGFAMCLFDNRRRTLHDRIAKTVVIYDWDARYTTKLPWQRKAKPPPKIEDDSEAETV